MGVQTFDGRDGREAVRKFLPIDGEKPAFTVLAYMSAHKIPFGAWIATFVAYLTANGQFVFDAISATLRGAINGLTVGRLWVPPLALVGIFAAFAYWLHRSWGLVAFVVGSFFLIMNLGYWDETISTLSLVFASTLVCILIGVPIGVLAAYRPWIYVAIRPILDLMQTIPTFVYLIPTLVLFGLGVVPGLISTVVFALPAPIRLTYLGISSVPTQLREAGISYGATPWQLLVTVELPYALPTVMAGITQCIMLSLSMVVIAALVGADGLGKPVVRALNTVNVAMGFEAGISIVVIAIMLDRLCKRPQPAKKGD